MSGLLLGMVIIIIIIINCSGLTAGGSIHLHTNKQNTQDGTHITITREKTQGKK
jgi:hypothetical protein